MDSRAYQEVAISLPFTIDSYGGVSTSSSASKIWADRVESVLGTAIQERVCYPNYGTKIPYLIMENGDAISDSIKSEVQKAFAVYLQGLTLTEVEVSPVSFDQVVQVTVHYTLPDLTNSNTTVGVMALNGDAPPVQGIY
jgi:phage baseplate assembly protein W